MWNESNGTVRPLNDEQVKSISSSFKQLIENIDCGDELLAELSKESCLTTLQKRSIRDEVHESTRNERLLDIMSCKSIAEFNKFMRCLANTGQRHLVALLTTDSGLSLNYLLTRG